MVSCLQCINYMRRYLLSKFFFYVFNVCVRSPRALEMRCWPKFSNFETKIEEVIYGNLSFNVYILFIYTKTDRELYAFFFFKSLKNFYHLSGHILIRSHLQEFFITSKLTKDYLLILKDSYIETKPTVSTLGIFNSYNDSNITDNSCKI